MTKKGSQHAPKSFDKGAKKNHVKASTQLTSRQQAAQAPGLSSKAGSFLKDRLGKKVKELRCNQTILALQADALERSDEFQREHEDDDANAHEDSFEAEASGNLNRETDNNRKKYYTELRKVIANADVIIEVLDARDPASCRSNELEKEILAAGKKLVLLLNKIDLVPRHAVEAWKKHLQRSFPTITFKAARSGARRPVHAMTSAENAPEGLLRSTHGVVGADELMQLLKNYCRMSGSSKTKAHVSVGIVGYPNTGKSSIINSMKRQCSVQVGGKAGVTKQLQEIPLDKKLTLIDSPGVVFSGHAGDPATVLRNVVSVESISDPVGVVEALMEKTPRDALLEFYGTDRNFANATEFLIFVAQSRGKLVKGSALDIYSAAKSVIQDWTAGRFRYFTMPPVSEDTATAAQVETSEFVQQLAPALDIDALFNSSDQTMDNSSLPQPLVLAAPLQGGNGDDSMDCDGVNSGMVEVDMESM